MGSGMLILASPSGTRFAMISKPLALSVTLALALSACAETPHSWPWEPPPQAKADAPATATRPVPPAKAVKPSELKSIRPQPRPATENEVETASLPPLLVGLSEDETTELLGHPAEEAAEPPGKIWIYQAAGCRLSVHLFPDMEKGGFYTLDYTVADGAREACLGKVAGAARRASR